MKKYKEVKITAARSERELEWDGHDFVNDPDPAALTDLTEEQVIAELDAAVSNVRETWVDPQEVVVSAGYWDEDGYYCEIKAIKC